MFLTSKYIGKNKRRWKVTLFLKGWLSTDPNRYEYRSSPIWECRELCTEHTSNWEFQQQGRFAGYCRTAGIFFHMGIWFWLVNDMFFEQFTGMEPSHNMQRTCETFSWDAPLRIIDICLLKCSQSWTVGYEQCTINFWFTYCYRNLWLMNCDQFTKKIWFKNCTGYCLDYAGTFLSVSSKENFRG